LQSSIGKVDLTYTNEMLKTLIETLIEFKKLPALRNYNFFQLFHKR